MASVTENVDREIPYPEPIYGNIPESLKALDQWILWRAEPRDNAKGFNKLPSLACNPSRNAKSDDPHTWTDYGTAQAACEESYPHACAGIGFVFTAEDSFVGIDLDYARDPENGEPLEWAQPILERFAGTYCEVSPSGTGYKIWARGEKRWKGSTKPYGQGAVEVFDFKRYFTATGMRYGDAVEVTDQQEALDWLRDLVFLREKRKSVAANGGGQSKDREAALDALRRLSPTRADDYDEWLKVGMALHSVDPSIAMCAEWDSWSQSSEKYDPAACLEKWNSFSHDAGGVRIGTVIHWANSDNPPSKRMPWEKRKERAKETGGKLSAKDDLDPEQAARAFLRDEFGYKGPDPTKPFEGVDPLELKIRYHREQFWIYSGDRYMPWSPDNVKARIVLYLQRGYSDLESKHVNNTLLHLKAICQVADSTAMPTWLCSGLLPVGDPTTRFAAVQNGLVDIEAAVSGEGEILIPHSPRWFSPVCLPFDYDPAATCPTWEVILNRNLDNDAELIAVVQEWFGYCLSTGTDLHAFFLAYGDGGTGKSATMGALRAMLGDANVSSVPLERLGDRFGLWDTFGKLANIAAEIGEVDKVAEGVLKSLTSGDLMQFERKFRDPVSAIPTAKLAFATNTLPRFVDHSEGLWRRMLIVPFNRKVTEAERIPGLDKPKGWAKIGELPGMFNWSIEGLRRLRCNGRFTKAAAVEALKLEYRKDCNPAAQFLEDNVREHPHGEILKSKLYDEYRTYCCNWGFRAVGASNFAKEVRRMFPSVDDVSRRNEQGGRDRGWVGITEGAEHGDLEAISTGDSSYYASEF